jgi:hypothetical protein
MSHLARTHAQACTTPRLCSQEQLLRVVLVVARQADGLCLQQYYAGNLSCMAAEQLTMAAAEGTLPSGWLGDVATPDAAMVGAGHASGRARV